jgi:hypothetical protein
LLSGFVEPFGGRAAGVGSAAEESGEEFQLSVVVIRADLVHRGVHPGVNEIEAKDFRASVAGSLDDDTAAVGGVAAALDPAAAFEPGAGVRSRADQESR